MVENQGGCYGPGSDNHNCYKSQETDAQRMKPAKGNEGEDCTDRKQNRSRYGGDIKNEEIEDCYIPNGRETDKIALVRLAVFICEMVQRDHHDGSRKRQPQSCRDYRRAYYNKSRHGDVI